MVLFELIYIIMLGPFIADYAVLIFVISEGRTLTSCCSFFMSFWSLSEKCLTDNNIISSYSFVYLISPTVENVSGIYFYNSVCVTPGARSIFKVHT